MAPRIERYSEFWPYYLREHARPGTRMLHFVGTGLALMLLAYAVATARWGLLIGVPVLGYLFAWIGHVAVERNRPATFRYPLWSLGSDVRMFVLWLSGRLDRELTRAGVGAAPR